jgi:hypothetical protein
MKKIKTRGVRLACPVCGDREAIIGLCLSTMNCTCESCGDSFAPETARKIIAQALAQWDRVCAWIASAETMLAPVQRDCDAIPFPAGDAEPCPVCAAAEMAGEPIPPRAEVLAQ